MAKTPSSDHFFSKLNRGLVSIFLLLVILYLGRHIFIPLAFACLFALLMVTPCNFIERYHIPRGLSSLMSIMAFVLIGFLFVYFTSFQLVRLKSDWLVLAGQISAGVRHLEKWIQEKSGFGSSGAAVWIRSYTSGSLTGSSSFLNGTVTFVSGTLLYLALIPIYTFLLLYYRGLILQFFIRKFGAGHKENVLKLFSKARYVIKGYVGGLLIEMLIVASLNCTGLYFAGMKYALLLGLIVALLNLIPYLGIFMACILSLLITLQTDSPDTTLRVIFVLVLVHLADAYFLFPKVVGSKVKINALAALLGVMVGGMMWGIPGMFLSLPAVALLKVVFDEVEELRAWGLLLGEAPL
ncbi:MAG TPA: AI-2E family transporter [Puia sp.]|jgi:predicted PurR-regulated permease PerM|nr:AI-2E family transporter [Puia sp.]